MSSLEAKKSQTHIILANALVRLLPQIPGLGIGTIITAEVVNRVRDVVGQNLYLLGSAVVTTGLLNLLPTLIVIAINAIGFTAEGVLRGK